MILRLLSRWFHHGNLNLSLSVVLVVPFVLQTVGTAVLVGYLWHQRGPSESETLVIGLYGLISFVALSLGALTIRSITQPIKRLKQASQALAAGEWQLPVSESSLIAEFNALAQSFNQTAIQLNLALQTSAAELDDVLNSVSSSIVRFRVFPDRSWEYDYQSPGCQLLFGYTAEEICADRDLWMSQVFASDRETILYPLFKQIFNCQTQTIEFRFHHKDGSLRWISATYSSRYDEANNCWIVTGVSSNVTARKQAEIALKQSENRLLELSHASPANIYILVRRIDGSVYFEYISRAIEAIHGIPVEAILADATLLIDHIHPDDRAGYEAAVQQSLETLQPFHYEWRITSLSGDIKWLQGNSCPKQRDNGNVAWYGVVIDITDRKHTETALAQEILRRRTLFDISIDGIVVIDQAGHVVEANASFANMLGYSLEEVTTLHLTDFDAHWTPQEMEQRINESDLCINIFETRHRRKDGTIYHVEISSNSVDWDGQTLQFCICRDISDRKRNETERQQTEAALRESEERLRIALEAAHMGNWDWNIVTNQIIWSESLERLMGLEPGTFDGRFETVANMIYPDDRQRVIEAITRSVEQGDDYHIEFRFVRPDGSIRWALSKGRVLRDQAGRMIRMAGVDVDITDRKQAEDALRDSEERFRAVFEQAAVGLEYTDLAGRLLLVNRALVNLLGYSEAELLALKFQDITHPDDLAQNQQCFQQLLAGEISSYSLEKRFIHKNGSHIWVNLTVSLIQGADGQPKLSLAVIEDIRDRKQAALELQQAKEAAEAANVAKSMFLANMSHELRTPLNVILGYAQLLSYDTSLTPEYLDYLRSIHRSGNHLLALINDVLDLSKIEAGRSTFDPSSFDLPDLMQTLWEMFRFRAESKGLELTLELAEVPRLITTDLNKLRQVMINLLNNAVKFTASGTIVLRTWVDQEPIATTSLKQAETIPILSTPYRLMIEVEDTGIGIAPDELETIFEAFSQASAGKHSTEGTGLGLTISQKFVQLMDGQLSAESQIGQGSKFSVAIPIQLANPNEQVAPIADRPVIGLLPGQPHYRILVVDDQLANRRLLTQILQKVGLDVREAASGPAAIQQWQTWNPHLIWMDLRMAGMTGYEAMQQIRQLEQGQSEPDGKTRGKQDDSSSPSLSSSSSPSSPSPPQPPIPIIALTAQAYQHDRDLALRAGFTDFVTKPFRTIEIFQQLATYLELRYLYADTANLSMAEPFEFTDKHQVLQPEALQVMPATWLLALHKAALNCSSEEVEALIAQIPAAHAALAKGLQQLAHNYDFEIIMHLSQPS